MIATTLSAGDFLAPGTRLGKYELIQRLAVGGMAELYLARCTGIEGFEKQVALKRILPQYAASEEFVTMFLDEARLAATLQHANIAQVYDIGQTAHGLFFTMELVRGADARELLKSTQRTGERIPMEHAVTIACGAAAGLHAAHDKTGMDGEPLGIVHRDVSPANIVVSFDGCVKVIDFGVAKVSRHQTQTRVGTLKGKISYMSPEQCQGEPVDRRCDVFALGIVLYELTTGQRLFEGDNEFAILKKIVSTDAPPPSRACPDYPPELERIVLRALARDREQRYQTAQALQLDLECFARAHGMVVSSVKLGEWMRARFAAKIRAWEEAYRRATRAAEELEIMVAAVLEREPTAGPIAGCDDTDEDLEVEMEVVPPLAEPAWLPADTRSRAVAAPPPQPRRRRLAGALAMAACLLIGGTTAATWLSGGEDARVEPAAAAPAAEVIQPPVEAAAVPWRPLAEADPAVAPEADRPVRAAEPEPRRVRSSASRSRSSRSSARKPRAPAWDPNSALPP